MRWRGFTWFPKRMSYVPWAWQEENFDCGLTSSEDICEFFQMYKDDTVDTYLCCDCSVMNLSFVSRVWMLYFNINPYLVNLIYFLVISLFHIRIGQLSIFTSGLPVQSISFDIIILIPYYSTHFENHTYVLRKQTAKSYMRHWHTYRFKLSRAFIIQTRINRTLIESINVLPSPPQRRATLIARKKCAAHEEVVLYVILILPYSRAHTIASRVSSITRPLI